MKKLRFLISSIVTLSAVCVCALTFTIAWYSFNHKEMKNEISGSVLESYFDSWDSGASGIPGSKTNPFVITNPQHYENLIKLYTQKIYDPATKEYVDFSQFDYYFEIGKKFGDSNIYQVYDVDDYGVFAPELTNVLNLGSLDALEPIGNDAHPFRQHLEGHNIVVQNFTVKPSKNTTGDTYNDVGIFGFVNNEAKVTNTYWTNFVIDTSGSEAGPHYVPEAAPHEENVRVGYLAGHIKTYESFVDCYVNNCRIVSPELSSKQRNDFSYYGLVEHDQAGGGVGGNSYEYSFDSQLWHDYFAANYRSISNMPLCVRNHESSHGADVPVAGKKFGSAITPGALGQYTINGHSSSGSTSDDLDYSLSTCGYISGDRQITQNTYDTKYKIGEKYYDSNVATALTNLGPAEQTQNGYYVFRNNTQWDYYRTSDTYTLGDGSEYVYPTFHFAGGSEYSILHYSSASCTFSLYLDNSTTAWEEWSITGDVGVLNVNITWPESNHTLAKGIPLGTHKMSLVVHKTGKHGLFSTTEHGYNIAIGTRDDRKVLMSNMSMDYRCHYNEGTEKWEYSLPNYNFDITDYPFRQNPTWESAPTIVASAKYTPLPKETYIAGADNFVAPLYYYVAESSQYIQLIDTDEIAYDNAVFNLVNNVYRVTVSEISFVPGTEKHHFVGDEKEVAEDPEPEKRYRSDCIDIVGGGVDFFYYNFFGTQLKICRVESESSQNVSQTIVKTIKPGDIGQKFYSTTYTRQSFVLYVKNVGSANDKTDDNFGSMDFTYYQLSSILGMNTCHPCFKKGTGDKASSSNFVNFSTLFGDPTEEGILNTYREVDLIESKIQKASYCCLDKDGKILGTYGRNGETTMSNVEKSKIATYVLAIGSFTNASVANWRLWIQGTRFSYVSNSGEGGNFGSVEFRSRDEKVITTYFNFNILEIPENTIMYVDVQFEKTATGGNYIVNIVTNKTIHVIFYNYYFNDGYTFTLNGMSYPERMTELDIEPTSLDYDHLPPPSWQTSS